MANTYTLIASNVLSSTTASVTFSAIPSTYTDLVLRISARDNRAVNNQNPISLNVNGDSSSNYSQTNIYGYQGPTVYSDRGSSQTQFSVYSSNTANNTSNTFSSIEIYFPNYTSTTNRAMYVNYVMENNVDGTGLFILGATAFLYRGSSAISTILLTPQNSASFLSGSSFYLYGIKNS